MDGSLLAGAGKVSMVKALLPVGPFKIHGTSARSSQHPGISCINSNRSDMEKLDNRDI